MTIEYTQPAPPPPTTVSPGSGSTGFTSRLLAFGDSNGGLVNAAGPTWDSSFNLLGIGTTNPVVHLQLVTTVAGAAAPQMAFQNPQSTVSVGFVGSSDFRIQTTNASLNIISSNIVIGGTTAQKVGFYGVTGVARPTSYTTGAGGTTRTNAAVTATTITTNTTNVAPHGFASTADMAAHTVSHANIVADITNIKQLLNSLINDLKSWGLSG